MNWDEVFSQIEAPQEPAKADPSKLRVDAALREIEIAHLPSGISNNIRGLGERAMDLAGSGVQFFAKQLAKTDPLANMMNSPSSRLFQAGGEMKGSSPDPNVPGKLGHIPRANTDLAEDYFRRGKYGKAASETVKFIGEAGVTSLADMAAALYVSVPYFASRVEELAQKTAQNDKRATTEDSDYARAVPLAGAIVALERLGGKLSLGKNELPIGSIAELPGRVGKGALGEGATEAPQEALEEFGTSYQTEKGATTGDVLRAGFWGGVAGAGTGGTVRAISETAGLLSSGGRNEQDIANWLRDNYASINTDGPPAPEAPPTNEPEAEPSIEGVLVAGITDLPQIGMAEPLPLLPAPEGIQTSGDLVPTSPTDTGPSGPTGPLALPNTSVEETGTTPPPPTVGATSTSPQTELDAELMALQQREAEALAELQAMAQKPIPNVPKMSDSTISALQVESPNTGSWQRAISFFLFTPTQEALDAITPEQSAEILQTFRDMVARNPQGHSEAMHMFTNLAPDALTDPVASREFFYTIRQEYVNGDWGLSDVAHFAQYLEDAGLTLKPDQIKPGEAYASIDEYVLSPVDSAMTKQARKIVNDFLQRYAPGLKVALEPITATYETERVWGRTGPYRGFDNETIRFVQFHPSVIRDNAALLGVDETILLAETLYHELGHVIMDEFYNNAPDYVKTAIRNEHRKWLREVTYGKNRKGIHFRGMYFAPGQLVKEEKTLDEQDLSTSNYAVDGEYWFSLGEFVAEKVAQLQYTRQPTSNSLVNVWFQALWAKMKKVYYEAVAKYPKLKRKYPALNAWLDSLQYKAARERLMAGGDKNQASTKETTSTNSKFTEALKSKFPEVDPRSESAKRGVSQAFADLPHFNRFLKEVLTIPQIEKMFRQVPGVTKVVNAMREFWAIKGKWTNIATETLQAARDLKVETNKQSLKAFERFAYAVTLKSDELGRNLRPHELDHIAQLTGLDANGRLLFERMRKDYTNTLNSLFDVLEADARTKFANDPITLQKMLQDYRQQRREMLARDYFPLMRFGRYFVKAVATQPVTYEGKQYNTGQIIYFSNSESPRDQEKEWQKIRRQLGANASYDRGVLDDSQQALIGMPGPLLQKLKDIAVDDFIQMAVNPTPQEIAAFRNKINKDFMAAELGASQGQRFAKHLLERKGTPGFSTDAIRSYASYMQTFGNFMARIGTRGPVLDGVRDIRNFKTNYVEQLSRGQANTLGELSNYLQEHFEYLVNPGNEWANLRSIATVWYLGFVVRSAFVNLTQIILASQPWLAKRFQRGKGPIANSASEAKSVAALIKAMKDVRAAWTGTGRASLEPDLEAALNRGYVEQFLDESLASELGAYSEGSTLQRILPGWLPGGKSKEINYQIRQWQNYSMAVFQFAEKVNRLTTFIAAYRMAKDFHLNGRDYNSLSPGEKAAVDEAAFTDAREGVETTQGEYARWARPNLMKGKKSIIFLFKLYLQHMTWILAKDPSRWKFLRNSAILGGILGMPFATNIKDIVEMMVNALSDDDERFDADKEMREWATEIGEVLHVAPDLLLKGTSRYGFGVLYPFDLHSSISLGSMAPGTDALNRTAPYTDPYATIGRTAEAVGGPAASILVNMYRAAAADGPGEFRMWERAMPTAMRGGVESARWALEGEDKGFKGETVLEFDIHNPWHVSEVAGRMAGFTPRRLTEKQGALWEVKQAMDWYEARRRTLRAQWAEAQMASDREAIADAVKAIQRFNNTRPKNVQGISNQSLRQSLQQRFTDVKARELGVPAQRKDAGLYIEMMKDYPDLEFEERVK